MSALSNDDFSRVPVPGAKLRPWWNLLVIELGVLISIPMFVIGGQYARATFNSSGAPANASG